MRPTPPPKYRNLLLAKRQEIAASLGVRFDTVALAGRIAEEDQAMLSHDEFVSVSVNRLVYEQLRYVNAALVRLDAGDYGICLGCGEAISARRLAAVPWAEYCVSCQQKQSESPEEEDTRIHAVPFV